MSTNFTEDIRTSKKPIDVVNRIAGAVINSKAYGIKQCLSYRDRSKNIRIVKPGTLRIEANGSFWFTKPKVDTVIKAKPTKRGVRLEVSNDVSAVNPLCMLFVLYWLYKSTYSSAITEIIHREIRDLDMDDGDGEEDEDDENDFEDEETDSERVRSRKAPEPLADPVDVLLKYSTLLDKGLITKEDFDVKKRSVLGIKEETPRMDLELPPIAPAAPIVQSEISRVRMLCPVCFAKVMGPESILSGTRECPKCKKSVLFSKI